MAYEKQTWENLPSQTTPINADRLTHIEDGIFNAAATADTAASDASSAISGLADKVDKVEGKGLSTNDFTDALKTKLDNIETGAEVNVQSDWNQSDNSADDYIKNKPSLGTSAYKNSTSVVTESSDLVESGAVFDALGFGNKNLLAGMEFGTINQSTGGNQDDPFNATKRSINKIKVERGSTVTISGFSSANGKVIRLFYYSSSGYLRTEVSDSFATTYLTLTIPDDVDYFRYQVAVASLDTNYQVEKGSTATAYEPYHASVEETKADNSVIGTVEDGTNPTKSYAVGEHFIRNGKFCTCTVAVTTSSTWTLGSNYVEGTIADNLVKQATFSGTTSDIGAVVIYNSNDRVILSAEIAGYITNLYKRSAGYGCVIRTPQGEALINTAASLTYYYI